MFYGPSSFWDDCQFDHMVFFKWLGSINRKRSDHIVAAEATTRCPRRCNEMKWPIHCGETSWRLCMMSWININLPRSSPYLGVTSKWPDLDNMRPNRGILPLLPTDTSNESRRSRNRLSYTCLRSSSDKYNIQTYIHIYIYTVDF